MFASIIRLCTWLLVLETALGASSPSLRSSHTHQDVNSIKNSLKKNEATHYSEGYPIRFFRHYTIYFNRGQITKLNPDQGIKFNTDDTISVQYKTKFELKNPRKSNVPIVADGNVEVNATLNALLKTSFSPSKKIGFDCSFHHPHIKVHQFKMKLGFKMKILEWIHKYASRLFHRWFSKRVYKGLQSEICHRYYMDFILQRLPKEETGDFHSQKNYGTLLTTSTTSKSRQSGSPRGSIRSTPKLPTVIGSSLAASNSPSISSISLPDSYSLNNQNQEHNEIRIFRIPENYRPMSLSVRAAAAQLDARNRPVFFAHINKESVSQDSTSLEKSDRSLSESALFSSNIGNNNNISPMKNQAGVTRKPNPFSSLLSTLPASPSPSSRNSDTSSNKESKSLFRIFLNSLNKLRFKRNRKNSKLFKNTSSSTNSSPELPSNSHESTSTINKNYRQAIQEQYRSKSPPSSSSNPRKESILSVSVPSPLTSSLPKSEVLRITVSNDHSNRNPTPLSLIEQSEAELKEINESSSNIGSSENRYEEINIQEKSRTPATEVEKKVQSILNELIKTEKTYVETLNETIQRIKALRKNGLKEETIRSNFDNLEEITQLHIKMYSNLKNTETESNQVNLVLNVLEYYVKFFALYKSYVSKKTLMEKAQTKLFKKKVFKIPDMQINWSSNLITPVQRLPRYQLLLDELLKVLPGDSPEHGSTSKILNHLKEIITEVDEETGKVAVAQEYGQLSWPKRKYKDLSNTPPIHGAKISVLMNPADNTYQEGCLLLYREILVFVELNQTEVASDNIIKLKYLTKVIRMDNSSSFKVQYRLKSSKFSGIEMSFKCSSEKDAAYWVELLNAKIMELTNKQKKKYV